MAEPIKISTSKYTKQGKVDIDGNIWDVVLPGAGTELRFSQASRACKSSAARIELLDKKIDNGSITDKELDQYDEYVNKYEDNERVIYGIFQNTFRDGTKDNSDVKKWVNDTPTAIIMLAFEDVKHQSNSEGANDTTGTTASA
jgi:hypothetical protein